MHTVRTYCNGLTEQNFKNCTRLIPVVFDLLCTVSTHLRDSTLIQKRNLGLNVVPPIMMLLSSVAVA